MNSAALMQTLGFQTCLTVRTTSTLCKRVPKHVTVGYGRNYSTTEDEWISVLPYGFCDGYTRNMANQGFALRELSGMVNHLESISYIMDYYISY